MLEYFISTHGARKGLADTALRTADSGYLTHGSVDVSQDVIVRELDCKTADFIEFPLILDGSPNKSVAGRSAAEDIHKPIKDGKPGKVVIVGKNEEITMSLLQLVEEFGEYADTAVVPVRPAQVPERARNPPALLRHLPRDGGMAEIGDAVGIIAAQSIGEPTQLTMRTFHTGGVAGADTAPRSAARGRDLRGPQPEGRRDARGRRRKGGHRRLRADDQGDRDADGARRGRRAAEPEGVLLPRRTRLKVTKGQLVEPGDALNEGLLNPAELLLLRDSTTTELYLVGEVQKVYKSQGVEIHDKHIELIVRQMLKKVRVDTNDTPSSCRASSSTVRPRARTPGSRRRRASWATFEPIILGITAVARGVRSSRPHRSRRPRRCSRTRRSRR